MAENSKQDDLRKAAKSLASFLCVTCLCAQVGAAELDFGKVATQDHPANDFSRQSIDHIFSSTNSTLTLSASPGDLMIDFARIHSVSHLNPPVDIINIAESADIANWKLK
ncbi:MAG: hypothetical protein WCJ71_10210 [Candidatus Omnitrophota bacterium]